MFCQACNKSSASNWGRAEKLLRAHQQQDALGGTAEVEVEVRVLGKKSEKINENYCQQKLELKLSTESADLARMVDCSKEDGALNC